MINESIEEIICNKCLNALHSEIVLENIIKSLDSTYSIILAEGFEERSLGLIEKLANADVQFSSVIIGRYTNSVKDNTFYHERFEKSAKKISNEDYIILENLNDGKWIQNALSAINSNKVIVDITGISNKAIFTVLDILENLSSSDNSAFDVEKKEGDNILEPIVFTFKVESFVEDDYNLIISNKVLKFVGVNTNVTYWLGVINNKEEDDEFNEDANEFNEDDDEFNDEFDLD